MWHFKTLLPRHIHQSFCGHVCCSTDLLLIVLSDLVEALYVLAMEVETHLVHRESCELVLLACLHLTTVHGIERYTSISLIVWSYS